MGMYLVLCTLSPKRLALVAEEPEILEDVFSMRHESVPVPGLLDGIPMSFGKPYSPRRVTARIE
jgi:hypothetical protein